MENRYRTSAHSRYNISYHIAFCPKYRRKIFKNFNIDNDLKEAVRTMAPYHDWIIEELETDEDHLHVCVSAPPRYSPAKIVNLLKTWTYKHVYRKHPELKIFLWGGKMWQQGYFVSTVSDRATKEELRRYIRNQKRKQNQLKLI